MESLVRKFSICESRIVRMQRWSWPLQLLMVLLVLYSGGASAQLIPGYYTFTCPNVESIVQSGMAAAYAAETRIAASLLRLHFHDCFVDGCDGSILLVDTPTFTGEQNSRPNTNSARGYNVIDDIKASVEAACPGVVSCADILTLAARDGVVLAGGPNWPVSLGRKDSFSASITDSNNDIPAPFFNVATLTQFFANVGLSQQDLVTLSGAHTIGFAHCALVNVPGNSRLYNWSPNSDLTSGSGLPDPNIDPGFLSSLQSICPQDNAGDALLNLDLQTVATFDNKYYQNLQSLKGLLNSDEALWYQNPFTSALVDLYAANQFLFFNDFVVSIIKMGNISPKLGSSGEIRTQCGFPNAR